MTPLVVGTREDVAGFALAGIDGVVCATRQEADQAIARADQDTLVFVSAEFARDVPRGPLVVALPSRS
jgi:vacuolar-type H+-ATPase subunit F/Vma7